MARFGPRELPEGAPALPGQPGDTPWPNSEWPRGEVPPGTDVDALQSADARSFDPGRIDEFGRTFALLVVQGGRIVHETYDADHDASSTLPSWSMAKSMLMAFIGILVRDGKLDIEKPAPITAWQGADDPRRSITLDQLLRMSSGLAFAEVYDESGFSDTIEMLFRSGQEDVAGYAERKPLEAAPGTLYNYSSGTSNILAKITHDALGLRGEEYLAVLRRELLDRIGMRSAIPKTDASGTWIASSYCFATAQDFARFGLFCLRDGCWDGERILPEGWIDYARTPTAHAEEQYGAHFWLSQNGNGLFSANGFLSQYVIMSPDRDLVVVRLGESDVSKKRALLLLLDEVVAAFPKTTR